MTPTTPTTEIPAIARAFETYCRRLIELFQGIRTGVLMIGPPGLGKDYRVYEIAKRFGVTPIRINPTTLPGALDDLYELAHVALILMADADWWCSSLEAMNITKQLTDPNPRIIIAKNIRTKRDGTDRFPIHAPIVITSNVYPDDLPTADQMHLRAVLDRMGTGKLILPRDPQSRLEYCGWMAQQGYLRQKVRGSRAQSQEVLEWFFAHAWRLHEISLRALKDIAELRLRSPTHWLQDAEQALLMPDGKTWTDAPTPPCPILPGGRRTPPPAPPASQPSAVPEPPAPPANDDDGPEPEPDPEPTEQAREESEESSDDTGAENPPADAPKPPRDLTEYCTDLRWLKKEWPMLEPKDVRKAMAGARLGTWKEPNPDNPQNVCQVVNGRPHWHKKTLLCTTLLGLPVARMPGSTVRERFQATVTAITSTGANLKPETAAKIGYAHTLPDEWWKSKLASGVGSIVRDAERERQKEAIRQIAAEPDPDDGDPADWVADLNWIGECPFLTEQAIRELLPRSGWGKFEAPEWSSVGGWRLTEKGYTDWFGRWKLPRMARLIDGVPHWSKSDLLTEALLRIRLPDDEAQARDLFLRVLDYLTPCRRFQIKHPPEVVTQARDHFHPPKYTRGVDNVLYAARDEIKKD